MGPWAIATFMELLLGYKFGQLLWEESDVSTTDSPIEQNSNNRDFKDFKQEFSNGRQDSKKFVSSKTRLTKTEMKQLENNHIQLITL